MSSTLVQTLLIAVLAVTVCTTLAKSEIGRAFLWALVLVAAVSAAIVWLRKNRPGLLIRPYRLPWAKKTLDVVCRLSGQQPISADVKTNDFDPLFESLLPCSKEDFANLTSFLKQEVLGHDRAVSEITEHLWNAVSMRLRSPGRSQLPPICSLLLVGPDSSGKQTLAQLVGASLFKERSKVVVRFGASDNEDQRLLSHLVETVCRQPHTVVILENLSAAASHVQSLVEGILVRGINLTTSQGTTVTFQNTVVLLVESTVRHEDFDALASRVAPATAEDLHRWCRLPPVFLEVCQPVLMPLSNEEATLDVVLKLIHNECAKWGVTAEWVDPTCLSEWAHKLSTSGAGSIMAPLASAVRQAVGEAQKRNSTSVRIGPPIT
jgi:hypothetical protein